MNFLEKALFSTGSIKVAKANSPFWYTSGTIGPYFINTHFLFGNEEEANLLLSFINDNKDNHKYFIPQITERVISFYNTNSLFKRIIDDFFSIISSIPQFNECDFISGGERRDWFFSPIIAHLSNKKLLYIYKDLSIYSVDKQFFDINNSLVCHICDLITQASSHKRAWIPAINNIKGKLHFNASIIDRDEGGRGYLEHSGINNFSAVIIDNDFLERVKSNNLIDDNQLKLIKQFKMDPIKYGKDFLTNNPNFLKTSLQDILTKSKAERCIKENPYDIKFE